MRAQLFYIYDPMCSWCWGYAPTWQRLQRELTSEVDIIYGLGGLAEDSDVLMPEAMQVFLQQTWRKIAQQLGTEFNFDFWQHCHPRRSTYPACRATLIAREFGKEQEMLTAIQHAYYLQAKNPSNLDTLQALAVDIGLDSLDFLQKLKSQSVDEQLMVEINKMRSLPINGFPALVLVKEQLLIPIPIDYQDWRKSFEIIMKKI
ncbi:DsbA family protein [Cognaticolwellia aestuarii]|uniref:DsbA family protein n=1 Tax=Cognaticolwellia aestuarii TaxID=329993 RepID=UPI002E26909D